MLNAHAHRLQRKEGSFRCWGLNNWGGATEASSADLWPRCEEVWGLSIEAAVHWSDCELLKASVLERLGERKRTEGAFWREGARWSSCDFTCSHPLILSRALCSHWCFFPISSQKLLFSLGGSFLYYADHFKLYSGFCANHIKVQKVLERGTTHILIFCIVTRNSMQKQTNPKGATPLLNLASVLLCCVRGSSGAHGWRFGLLFWEANQLCMKVNVPEWDGGWKRGERCLSSLAPAPRTKEHTALHLSVCDLHFQSIIALFSSNRWCLNKYMHI